MCLSLIISLMSESGIPIPLWRRFLITSTSLWNKDLFPDDFLGPLAQLWSWYIFEDTILGKVHGRTSLPQKRFARSRDQLPWCELHLANEVLNSETFALLVARTYETFLLSQNVAFRSKWCTSVLWCLVHLKALYGIVLMTWNNQINYILVGIFLDVKWLRWGRGRG